MDTTWIAIGILGFAVACCIAAVLGQRKVIADMRELMDMRKEWHDKDHERVWERVWALSRGMDALGMQYQPGTKTDPTYIKR